MNRRERSLRDRLAAVTFGAAAVAWWFSDFGGQSLLAEMAVLAILAMSLDFLVGYAGIVSLGHALYFGVGAYAMAGLMVHLSWPGGLAWAASVGMAALVALATGALVVKLTGLFVIMTTLAFGQMGWAYVLKSPSFGGFSGMAGIPMLDLGAVGLNLANPHHFTLFCLLACIAVFIGLAWLVDTPFGHALRALHENEGRAEGLGLPVNRYKLVAFVVAGTLAGLAGSLSAQRTQFVSPDLMVWTLSGEALIVVILGGARTLSGPLLGAVAWVLLRHLLSELTTYWMFIMGLLFIAVVLFAERGIYGLLITRRLRGDSHV